MRIRANSILAALTEDQLNKLYDWIASGITYRAVQERCSQPHPEGFGLEVHLKTLWSFFKAERRRRHAEELAETKFNDLAAEDPEQLYQNIKVELAHACYDLANYAGAPNVNVLARITHRLDLIRLEQQRLALEREFLAEKKRQFNFNAARAAAHHAAKIHKVIETKGPDNEDKIWMVNDIVFGPAPTPEDNSPSTPQIQNSTNQ
jgi:hypothetical protein